MPSLDVERAAADIPLTRMSRDVLDAAGTMAAERGSASVSPADVLRSILANRGSRATDAMQALGSNVAAIEGALAAADGEPGPPLRQLLVTANREAQVLGHYQVDPGHLLLALLYTDSPTTSAA